MIHRLQVLGAFIAPLALGTASSHAQFAVFNPDSYGDFYVVSTPDNSTNGSNHANVGASGEFLWDSTQGYLRVIVNNLAGTDGFDPNGYITSFGFSAPDFDTVQLKHYGTYDNGTFGAPGSMSFQLLNPYNLSGGTSGGGLAMDIGTGTGSNANGGGNPNRGIGPNSSAYFDFLFTGIPPEEFNFHGFGFSEFPQPGDPFTIAFRFQATGINGEGSDKFGGWVIPEPSTYGMAGIGVLALLALTRRFGKK